MKLANRLPQLLSEIVKSMMPGAISQYDDERKNAVRNTREAKDFVDSHPNIFKTNLKYRKQKFEQYSRSVHIVNLYDECLVENPPYIPKRFREDKHHVRNERELEKVFNKSMASFQCEYDILTIRKVDYKEQLDTYKEKIQSLWTNKTSKIQ